MWLQLADSRKSKEFSAPMFKRNGYLLSAETDQWLTQLLSPTFQHRRSMRMIFLGLQSPLRKYSSWRTQDLHWKRSARKLKERKLLQRRRFLEKSKNKQLDQSDLKINVVSTLIKNSDILKNKVCIILLFY